MLHTDKIAYCLLALFLTLHELDPLPADAMDISDHGAHRIWSVAAHVPPALATPGFYDQLSCSLWEYVEHYNRLRGSVHFQPYELDDYPSGDGGTVVRVSVYQ